MNLAKNKVNISEFVKNIIADGVPIKTYAKFACIQAKQATKKTFVETVLVNGKKETINTAKKGDWIITNKDGEQYIISAKAFMQKYEPNHELGNGWYNPIVGVQRFVETPVTITFICSWGEEQTIDAGGFINISSPENFYGVARQEFFDTYKECDPDGNFI